MRYLGTSVHDLWLDSSFSSCPSYSSSKHWLYDSAFSRLRTWPCTTHLVNDCRVVTPIRPSLVCWNSIPGFKYNKMINLEEVLPEQNKFQPFWKNVNLPWKNLIGFLSIALSKSENGQTIRSYVSAELITTSWEHVYR